MDLEDDVLFLMLTSHGSEQPSLTVSNGAWPLVQLDGRELRSALDASGIRWRVIVISACHSGAFIEPLASETTIVLSASAKERTSFGCDDKSELTYFGQALMRDALPRAESLASAFERAKQLDRRARATGEAGGVPAPGLFRSCDPLALDRARERDAAGRERCAVTRRAAAARTDTRAPRRTAGCASCSRRRSRSG